MSDSLSNGQIVTTLNGSDVTVTINSTGVYINNAQVTVTDILASNGLVHVIDAVLLPTIYDVVAASNDHTTLKVAIDTCGLDVALSSSGSKTLFAPTDAAFSLLPAGTITALLADIPQLTDILLYHVVGDSILAGDLTNGQIMTTLNGADVTVTIDPSGVYINNAKISVINTIASNGVVHVIDAVLLPSIYDVVSTSNDHATLETAIDTCGLDVALSSSGSKTLFAPTDAAFSLLPAGQLTALLSDSAQLTNILLYHVVGDSVMSNTLTNGQIVTTLQGSNATVSINPSGVYINNAQVTVTDILASNGVVHVIDLVLLPNSDCYGIPNGTALVDTCGICHQAYIYDVITHSVVFVDDTSGITLLPTEQIIMPDNPANPYWNACFPTIYDIVSASSDHTTLETAIDACGLNVALSSSGSKTLFAPTDAAFNLLPAGQLTALLADIPQLTDILLYHVIGDSIMSDSLFNGQILTTLQGTDVNVTIDTSGVYINNAKVSVTDILASNGVVHVIDAVLLLNTSAVVENEILSKGSYLYTVNILGKIISRDTRNQIVFDIYSNGEIQKRYTR